MSTPERVVLEIDSSSTASEAACRAVPALRHPRGSVLGGAGVSREDLQGWGGRELLLAVLPLGVVLALVVIALADWVAA